MFWGNLKHDLKFPIQLSSTYIESHKESLMKVNSGGEIIFPTEVTSGATAGIFVVCVLRQFPQKLLGALHNLHELSTARVDLERIPTGRESIFKVVVAFEASNPREVRILVEVLASHYSEVGIRLTRTQRQLPSDCGKLAKERIERLAANKDGGGTIRATAWAIAARSLVNRVSAREAARLMLLREGCTDVARHRFFKTAIVPVAEKILRDWERSKGVGESPPVVSRDGRNDWIHHPVHEEGALCHLKFLQENLGDQYLDVTGAV